MNKESKIRDKYSYLETAIYAILWLIVFLLPFAIETYDAVSGRGSGTFEISKILSAESIIAPIFIFFLLNNYVLLPDLFFKKHKISYFLIIIAGCVVLWYLQTPPAPRHPAPANADISARPPFDMFHITNLIIEICVLLANFAIKVYIQSLRRDVQLLNIKNEKMQSELESLKYQISPHFLMNTLNNIQSLIEIDQKRAYATIQGLSRMMRYLLYENAGQTVSLQKEINFMSDFIGLMKIRYPEKVAVTTDFPSHCERIHVPPLLFISFIENAFKYGVSLSGESYISVGLEVSAEKLVFRCENSKSQRRKSSESGLGIENVRKRLDLIYGHDYSLNIADNATNYQVEMILPIISNTAAND